MAFDRDMKSWCKFYLVHRSTEWIESNVTRLVNFMFCGRRQKKCRSVKNKCCECSQVLQDFWSFGVTCCFPSWPCAPVSFACSNKMFQKIHNPTRNREFRESEIQSLMLTRFCPWPCKSGFVNINKRINPPLAETQFCQIKPFWGRIATYVTFCAQTGPIWFWNNTFIQFYTF